MILYHGTNLIVKEPKLIKTDKGRDFGIGFYLTPIKAQAERQAIRKVKQERNGKPIVCVFEWNEKKKNLKCKKFKNASLDWLELIIKCRTDFFYKHGYDIVEGKIADDSVGETILFVINKIMRKEDALERIKYQKINYQIAFCSEGSLKTIKFKKSYEVRK